MVCVNCGARLDPGERCDCEKREAELREDRRRRKLYELEKKNPEEYERAMEEHMYA